MRRRTFLAALPILTYSLAATAHSPWGQYAVYRQKHLLVLSTRDDPGSYEYSKLLVEAINTGAPEAKARPARAINLERAYNLLRTDQFQFALLSSRNIKAMRDATGPFAGNEPVNLKTIYLFGDLEFVVLGEFPAELVEIVADAILSNISLLPGAAARDDLLASKTLHVGARNVLNAL